MFVPHSAQGTQLFGRNQGKPPGVLWRKRLILPYSGEKRRFAATSVQSPVLQKCNAILQYR